MTNFLFWQKQNLQWCYLGNITCTNSNYITRNLNTLDNLILLNSFFKPPTPRIWHDTSMQKSIEEFHPTIWCCSIKRIWKPKASTCKQSKYTSTSKIEKTQKKKHIWLFTKKEIFSLDKLKPGLYASSDLTLPMNSKMIYQNLKIANKRINHIKSTPTSCLIANPISIYNFGFLVKKWQYLRIR